MLLSAANLVHAVGGRTLFDGLSLRLDRGDRAGLVGDNGAGKTTLLRCLTGELTPDAGDVSTARGTTVGLLRQDPDFTPGNTCLDEAEASFAELHTLAAEMRRLEHEMADGHPEVMDAYTRVSHDFEQAGGYDWRHRVEAALTGVGLGRELWEADVDRLSGGQRSRLQLAVLLVRRPDVLLLDEPTNHLDLDAIEWLENELGRFKGAVLLVSHDRFLLDRLANRIDHMEGRQVQSYPGNYAAFVKQREADALTRERAFEKQQRMIEKEAEYVRRFKAGQRARQAKGRETRLNRMLASGDLVTKQRSGRGMGLSFAADKHQGDFVLRTTGMAKAFGKNVLWNDVAFTMAGGERLGIVGPNGCGKTTLLRCLVGEADADAGEVRWAPDLKLGYYDQRLDDFDPDNSVLDELYPAAVAAGQTEKQLRSTLGTMRFGGDDVFKPMSALSGGERARVALTRLLLEGPDVLVLDEPTNHLDLVSREALEEALRDFAGSILAVSHDRYFLSNVTGRLLVMGRGGAVDFRGGWRDWLARRDAASPAKPPAVKKNGHIPPKAKPKSNKANKYLRPFGTLATPDLERRITNAEVELAELQGATADGVTMSDPSAAKRVAADLERVGKQLAQMEEEYFSREA